MKLLEALTPEEKAAYRERLKDVLERADTLDAEMLAATRELVQDAADALQDRWVRIGIEGATDWQQWITPLMQSAVAEVARDLADKYGMTLADFLPGAYANGDALALAGIGSSGLNVSALPGIHASTVQIASQFSADLITNIEAEVLTRVNGSLRKAFVLGDSPWTVMQNIAQSGIDAGPWRSVGLRAEVIARTELARVQNLGSQYRMSAVVREHPDMGMRKAWLVAHIKEWPCQTCAPREGEVWDVDDPEAPELPAHPRCRCAWISYFPGLSSDVKKLGYANPVSAESARKLAGERPIE